MFGQEFLDTILPLYVTIYDTGFNPVQSCLPFLLRTLTQTHTFSTEPSEGPPLQVPSSHTGFKKKRIS